MRISAYIVHFFVFAAGFADDGAGGDSGDLSLFTWEFWLLSLLLSLVICIGTYAVFYLIQQRESISLETGEQAESAPPEKRDTDGIAELKDLLNAKAESGADAIKEFGERLQTNSEAVLADTKNTLQTMRELFESYMTLQKNLDEKDAEIKRLKGGYDAEIFRRFLYRFIRIDKTVNEYINDTQTSESAIKDLRLIQGLFEDALDECGVEKFSPEIGSDFRKESDRVADHPETEPTNDAGKNFLISAVLSEGYMLKLPENGHDVIMPAKVKIYKHQKEN